MADLGLTKLKAVNRMLRTIPILPVAALDPSGSSEASRAEEVLDEVTDAVLLEGYYDNFVRCKLFTAVASEITVTSDVLRVRSAGPNQHRNFTLKSDKVYDLDRDTSTFASATEQIYLDVWKKWSFVDLAPQLKELITNRAAVVYQSRRRGSPDMDQTLTRESAQAEVNVNKPGIPLAPSQTPNPFPLLSGIGGNMGGQQGGSR